VKLFLPIGRPIFGPYPCGAGACRAVNANVKTKQEICEGIRRRLLIKKRRQITEDEARPLRFQSETSKDSRGGRRYLPHVFTKLRELLATNELIRQKIEELERKYEKHDTQFKAVFEAIRELLETPKPKPKKPIGFHAKY